MSEKIETLTFPRKEVKDIYTIGKHSITLKDGSTVVEWEITPQAKKALLDFYCHKPNMI